MSKVEHTARGVYTVTLDRPFRDWQTILRAEAKRQRKQAIRLRAALRQRPAQGESK